MAESAAAPCCCHLGPHRMLLWTSGAVLELLLQNLSSFPSPGAARDDHVWILSGDDDPCAAFQLLCGCLLWARYYWKKPAVHATESALCAVDVLSLPQGPAVVLAISA